MRLSSIIKGFGCGSPSILTVIKGRLKHLFTDKVYCIHFRPQEPEFACFVVLGRLKLGFFLKERVKFKEGNGNGGGLQTEGAINIQI